MSKWSSLSADDKAGVLKNLHPIYEANPWVKPPTYYNAHVYILKKNMKQPEQGRFEIKGTAPIEKQSELEAAKAKIQEAVSSVSGAQVSLGCGVDVGDKMVPLANATKVYHNGEAVSGEGTVEHNGEVMLFDFWATWCPPCQGPMAHNQKMLESRGKDWGDKVRLVGLSIDSEAEAVKKHVEFKKWTNVEHWWVRNGKCSTAVYNFKGVPHVALVDKSGTIVFKGHPAHRPNLEGDIDKLLKGEPLDGVQMPKSVDSYSEEPLPEGGMNAAEASAKIEGFNKEAAAFMEEHKANLAKFRRAFLVLEVSEQMSLKEARTVYPPFTVHFQLIGGPQSLIDELQPHSKKFEVFGKVKCEMKGNRLKQ